MMKADYIAYLLTKTGVTALVGTRIRPGTLGQSDTGSSIAVQTISHVPASDLEGESGFAKTRLQVDCWADSDNDAAVLAEAVRDASSGFRGAMGNTFVHGCYLETDSDEFEKPTAGTEVQDYRVSMDFEIDHDESVPSL